MRPTALGVGVAGGGMAAVAADFRPRRLGVDGAAAVDAASPSRAAAAVVGEVAFLLRDVLAEAEAGGGGGGIGDADADADASTCALIRADLRLAMTNCAVRGGRDGWS